MNDDIQIAICDANKKIIETLKAYIHEALADATFSYQIHPFQCSNQLLASKTTFDLLLLDTKIANACGFHLARQLNQLRKPPLLIFITKHQEKVMESFHVRAFRFLKKPIDKATFFEALYSGVIETWSNYMIVRDCRNIIKIISFQDILYVKASKDGCYFFMEEKQFFHQITLNSWLKQAPFRLFIQTHRQYIINITYIEKIKERVIFLKNGVEIPIATRRESTVKKEIKAFFQKGGKT